MKPIQKQFFLVRAASKSKFLPLVVAISGALLAVAETSQAQNLVFSEDWDTDHSLDGTYVINKTAAGVHLADLYFDYSTVGIPSAPHSTGGSTRGLKMNANLDLGTPTFGGVSVSPVGFGITENFEMRFDAWFNFNGPAPGGGSGSTQVGGAGYGTAGTTAQTAGVADSVFIGGTADGGSSADYRVYSPAHQISYQDGAFRIGSSGTDPSIKGDPNSGYVYAGTNRNCTGSYYTSHFPAQTAPAAQTALFPQQTGTAQNGSLAFKWHDVSLKKMGNVITYSIENVLIATVDVTDAGTFGGTNILFNHYDINSTVSSDPNRTNLIFTLIDNVRITKFANALPVSVVIGRVRSSGNNVIGATVQFDGIGKSAITDNQGRFAISNLTASSGYLLNVSAAGYAIKRFPNINVFTGTNNLGDLQIGNPVNLPAQLRPLVPDVNLPVSSVEEGGTAYRYYQVVATDGRTLVGGVIVGLRRADGLAVLQDGDISTEWAGYETGKPDADGLVRLRLPSLDIGNAGSTATFEVLLGATVAQTFTATVKPREYEQVWKHKWSVELGKKKPGVRAKFAYGQSHETKIIRKFGGFDDGLEIVGRERDEEFKGGVGLDFGARVGRTGAGASVGLDGSLKVGLGQSFRFSPDTTDVLDNLLKLNAAFADNLNLVPLGGIVLEGIREQLEGYFFGDQVESTDTSLKLSGHAKGEAYFGAAVPWSDELAIYAHGELAADVGLEVGASYHPGRFFDSYVEFSGNLKLDYDAKNTFGTPAFFQAGGLVKGTVRRDPDGYRPRQLILESSLSVTTDSAQPIGWNDNDILQLQPLETAEYRAQYTLRMPGLNDTLPAAQSAWESINQRGQGSVFKLSQPVAWLSSLLGAGETVAYDKFIYAAHTTLATSPILGLVPVIHIQLDGEKHKGAVVKTEAGLLWKNRRIALENYVETPRVYYPSKDIFELERKWLDYAAAPIGGFLNRAVHGVSQAGETIIRTGQSAANAVVRFGQGVMSGASQVTTTWVHYLTGGGQLAPTLGRKDFALLPEESFLPATGTSNFVYGIGGVYRFDSTNAFNGSGTLTIAFTDGESDGLNKADLQIYHLPDGTNRWRRVGGIVNALSNTVTVAITNLGTFAIAPPLPSGDLILSVASNTLPADGVATSIITVSNLMLNNGLIATQLWLYTVASSGVEITDSDVTTNYSGVQLVSTNGVLRFTVRAPLGGNSANISVASVAGDAAGELAINLVDNAPPLAPSGVAVSTGKSRVLVSWQTNAETDLAGYRVYYRAGVAGPPWDGTAAVEGSPSPIAVAGTNLTLRGLATDTNYFVALVAVDTTGNESLPTVVGPLTPTNTPPQPPTGLAVSFGSDGTNFLSWALSEDDGYNDRDVVRYDIYRAVFPGGAFEKIGEAPAGVGLFSETNLTVAASNYLRYAVIAMDTNGQSSAQVLANHFLASGNGVDNDREGMADDWESSHGLNPQDPADGDQDLDGDSMSNLAEYRAGTNPNDSQSFLWIQSIGVGGANGVQITWGSVSDKLYSIQRASLLVPGGATFTNLAEHIRSTPPQNVFLDTTATNSSQFFYRVKVE